MQAQLERKFFQKEKKSKAIFRSRGKGGVYLGERKKSIYFEEEKPSQPTNLRGGERTTG